MPKVVYTNKEPLITGLLILACLAMLLIMPFSMDASLIQIVGLFLVFLVIVPAVYIRFVIKKSFSSFGFQLGDWQQGLIWGGISMAIQAVAMFILVRYTTYLQHNELLQLIGTSFSSFLAYELLAVGAFSFCFEFFFRGLILFSFAKQLEWWSVALQAGLFVILLFISNQLGWFFIPYVIASVTSGLVAYRTRSLAYSFGSAWLFMILADALLIKLFVR